VSLLKSRREVLFGVGAMIGTSTRIVSSNALVGVGPISRGGRILASMDLIPRSLDPLVNFEGRNAINQIYEGLVRSDENGNLLPALAESWTYGDDYRTIDFRLRKDVKFHDGTDFDAEAAVFNLRRAINPATAAAHANDLPDVASIDALAPDMMRVNLKTPSGAVLPTLALDVGMMASPTALRRWGADFGRNPVGTGPFKLAEWVADSHVSLVRNEAYWRNGVDGRPLPYVDEVRLRFLTNSAAKMVELRGGGVHLVDSVTPREFAEVEKYPELKLVDTPGGIISWLAFNNARGPFTNVALRRAISAGVDRSGLMKALALGYGSNPPTLIIAGQWAYDDDVTATAYDPEYGRRILRNAGIATPVSFTLSVIRRDPDEQIALFVQSLVQAIGVDLKIEMLERQAWVAKIRAAQHDIAIGRVNAPYLDPDLIFRPLFGKDASANWAAVTDEGLADAVADARHHVEYDIRRGAYARIQQHILDNAYYDFLFYRQVKQVARKELQNIEMDATGSWVFANSYFG
jgi:peptide/nickel transport system substrate-binding protein